MKKKQEEIKKEVNVFGAIFSSVAMLATLWGTFYFNQTLSCNYTTMDLFFDAAECSTRWAFFPLWITGLFFLLLFGSLFLEYTQDLTP